jgi:ubiquinone/menaquinone biosynthesis C-methylase UbiE
MRGMAEERSVHVFDWAIEELTPGTRKESAALFVPHLAPLYRAGDAVLDLCCGAGAVAFMLESQGAVVTGIDCAPGMIEQARQEASRLGSRVEFIQADVLAFDPGEAKYDLGICLGNAILDFPHEAFPGFRDSVHRALKPGGKLVIDHMDGVMTCARHRDPKEVVTQETPERIERSFKGYDPVLGAFRSEHRNLTRGETVEYTGYVYTGPLLRLALEPRFDLERSIRLSEREFLDVYSKR